jgi:hypothetical protein
MFLPAKWARDAARTYWQRGNEAFDTAEATAAEIERTRNLPWHYADEHVTGEILAVESAERCCTAHGDEPCAQDSGFVPPYCCGDCPDRMPALSAQSHEDEQAANEDTDRPGMWVGIVVGTLWFPFAWLIYKLGPVVEAAYERLADAVGEMRQSWQTRNEVGTGEPVADPFERFRIDDNPRGRSDELPHRMGPIEEAEVRRLADSHRKVMDAHPLTDEEIAAEVAELTGEPVDVVIERRQGHRYLPTGAYPLVRVTGAEGGRHRKADV